jgi:hypothetical protein
MLAMFLLLAGGSETALAIPAFAKKTGLRCSACHEAWPKLNAFGQAFRDNGYQIGNERDSPRYLSPLYWPAGVRYTPQWHRELNSAEATDQSATGVQPVTTHGFDLSGIDLWFAGVLEKNISFLVLPSSDEYGNFHFESGWVRFDNLMKTPWMNLKAGKFELDEMISEKRMLTLSQVGGIYEIYHYLPLVDPKAFAAAPLALGETGVSATGFGLGDNQLGLEIAGHSHNDYTRYSVSMLTSSDGSVNLPTSKGYDTFLAASHQVNINSLGPETVGAFSYIGQSPTRYAGRRNRDEYSRQRVWEQGLHAHRRVCSADREKAGRGADVYARQRERRHCAGHSRERCAAGGRRKSKLERTHAGALLHAEPEVHCDCALRRHPQLAADICGEREQLRRYGRGDDRISLDAVHAQPRGAGHLPRVRQDAPDRRLADRIEPDTHQRIHRSGLCVLTGRRGS